MLSLLSSILALTSVAVEGGTQLTIRTVSDYIAFTKSYEAGMTVVLDSDLDFTDVEVAPIGQDWPTRFIGTFDGQGHVIRNLKMESSSVNVGLFGYANGYEAGHPTYVQNLIFDETCSFTSTAVDEEGYSYAIGPFFAYCHAGDSPCRVLNSVNLAPVTFAGSVAGELFIGGLAGHFTYGDCVPTIRNSANYGAVAISGTAGGKPYMGGLVGNGLYTALQNSANFGTLAYAGTSAFFGTIGGLAGNVLYGRLENCVSAGLIKVGHKEAHYVGALLGDAVHRFVVKDCFWSEKIEYEAYGNHEDHTQSVDLARFDGELVLNQTVSAGEGYRGTSLIEALNAEAAAGAAKWGYSMWMVNKRGEEAEVEFVVNYGKGFKEKSRVMLLPNLVGDGNKTFRGWYTDVACTNLFTDYKNNAYTQLYGAYY